MPIIEVDDVDIQKSTILRQSSTVESPTFFRDS